MHRDELLSKLRGINATILTRSIDIMVSRVRNKIGDKAKPARLFKLFGVVVTSLLQKS